MSEATSSHRLPYGVAPPTFRLPDASHVGRSDLGRFASHLASSGLRPGMADHSVSEALYLWDPDGLGIEIYADRPRDGWRRHNRELEMNPKSFWTPVSSFGRSPSQSSAGWANAGNVHFKLRAPCSVLTSASGA